MKKCQLLYKDYLDLLIITDYLRNSTFIYSNIRKINIF
jgi:hypothetical protein